MIEPYRMVEPVAFSDDALEAITCKDIPPVKDVLTFAGWFTLIWIFAVGLMLL